MLSREGLIFVSLTKVFDVKRKRIPLHTLFILPFIIQIGLFVLLIGLISFRNGESIVKELVTTLASEISQRIDGQIEAFLSRPHRLNTVTAELIQGNQLNAHDPGALQQFFYRLVRANPVITSMYFGNVDGGIAGSGREGTESRYYLTDSPDSRPAPSENSRSTIRESPALSWRRSPPLM